MHGNSSVFVRELTKQEKREISKSISGKDRNITDRYKVVKLSSLGKSVPEIMKILRRCRNYVFKWIDRFNRESISGFSNKLKVGRPVKFRSKVKKRVCEIACKMPFDLYLHFSTWSLRKLENYFKEQGIDISYSEIRLILKEQKIKLRKSKKWIFSSKKPDFFKRKRVIDKLIKRKLKKTKVISFDEKGTITVKKYDGRSLSKKAPLVPDKQKIKGKFELICGYDVHNNDLYYDFYNRKTHQEVAESLIKIKKQNKHYKIIAIVDNWKPHKSDKLIQKIKPFNIKLVFLPIHASWLNNVERVFSDIQLNVLQNSNEKNVKNLKNRISKYLDIEYPKKI